MRDSLHENTEWLGRYRGRPVERLKRAANQLGIVRPPNSWAKVRAMQLPVQRRLRSPYLSFT